MGDFHQTRMRQIFYEQQVPQLIRAMTKNADNTARLAEAIEKAANNDSRFCNAFLPSKNSGTLYNVFIDSVYVRDAQVFDPDKNFDIDTDIHSADAERNWKDFTPKAYLATVSALSEEAACTLVSADTGYRDDLLYAVEVGGVE